jgi:hypothetical protein
MRNPFDRSGFPFGSRKRISPDGEPLEGSGVSRSFVRIVIPIKLFRPSIIYYESFQSRGPSNINGLNLVCR